MLTTPEAPRYEVGARGTADEVARGVAGHGPEHGGDDQADLPGDDEVGHDQALTEHKEEADETRGRSPPPG